MYHAVTGDNLRWLWTTSQFGTYERMRESFQRLQQLLEVLQRLLEAATGYRQGPLYDRKCSFYFNYSFRTTPTNLDLKQKAVYFPARVSPYREQCLKISGLYDENCACGTHLKSCIIRIMMTRIFRKGKGINKLMNLCEIGLFHIVRGVFKVPVIIIMRFGENVLGPKGTFLQKRVPRALLFLHEVSIVVLIDFTAILLTPGIFLIQICIHFYNKNIKMYFPKSWVLKFQNHFRHSLSIATQWNKLHWQEKRLLRKVQEPDFQKGTINVMPVLRALCKVRLGFGVINRGHCCRYVFLCEWFNLGL